MAVEHFVVSRAERNDLATHVSLVKQKALNLIRHKKTMGGEVGGEVIGEHSRVSGCLLPLLALEALDIAPLFFIRAFKRVLHGFVG